MNQLARHVIALAAVAVLFPAHKLLAQNPGKTWMQYSSPEEAGFSSEKLNSVLDLYKKNGASALMVVFDGKVLLSTGDITRRYDTHSMRKSLVSALYGIYSSAERINIHKTLKELGIDDAMMLSEEEKSATIQDLLKARSGVYIPAFGEAQSMKNERPARGSHPPNTFYYYNNWDFNVLGAIFTIETGLDLFEALEASIAQPLHMEDFRPLDGRFWRDSTVQTIYPKYDIKLSARDLARFGVLYCQDGFWNRAPVIPKDWIAQTFTPYSTIDHVSYKESYGYLWWIEVIDDSITTYSARGWGGHILTIAPKEKLVLVKRHDTFGGTGGDGLTGKYVRLVVNARVTQPKPDSKLVPLEAGRKTVNEIEIKDARLKEYEQDIPLNGRMRSIRYTKYGLVYDDWFVLHPVSQSRFYIEDLEKYMYFRVASGKPVFDRIE